MLASPVMANGSRRLAQSMLLAILSLLVVGCGGETNAQADSAAPAGSTGDPLAGSWTLTIDTPRGVQHPVLEVIRTADGYRGAYSSRGSKNDIGAITLDGNNVSFPLSISIPIGTIDVTYRATLSGDTMQGVVANPRGEVPFTATRS